MRRQGLASLYRYLYAQCRKLSSAIPYLHCTSSPTMTEAESEECSSQLGRLQRSVLLLFFVLLFLSSYATSRCVELAFLPTYPPIVLPSRLLRLLNLAVCFFFFFSFRFFSYLTLPCHSSPSPHTSHSPSSNNLLLLIGIRQPVGTLVCFFLAASPEENMMLRCLRKGDCFFFFSFSFCLDF